MTTAQHNATSSRRSSAGHTTVLSSRPAKAESGPPVAPAAPEQAAGEEAVFKVERKLQALLSTLSELLFVVAKDGTVLDFRAPPDNDFMLSADGLVGKRVMELLPAQFGQQAMHYVEKTLRTGQVQVFSTQFQMATGLRQFEARLAVFEAGRVVALVRDVTDRTFLEKEILEISHREQMRIGQDLHDGLGQHLTGITFLAKALERKLAAKALSEAAEAAEINTLVMQALSQTRSLARGLFPVELESNGLVPAFRELAERVGQMCDIACAFECEPDVTVNDRTAAMHLFRLAQEAISNSVRHGKAKRVTVSLKADGDKLVFTVRDDGAGLPAGPLPTRGLGLRIMNYRAQKIGGTLDVQPAGGGGTVVRCVFPNSPK
jgi:signal transduction histidine kinase